jgi:hypothetical protein
MKSRLFALAVSIFMMAFVVNTSILAQSKEVKNPPKTIKQTEQKIDAKANTVKGTTDAKMKMNTEKAKETMKTEMKKDMGKMDMKKKVMDEKVQEGEKIVKHHQMPVKKVDTKKTETGNKY